MFSAAFATQERGRAGAGLTFAKRKWIDDGKPKLRESGEPVALRHGLEKRITDAPRAAAGADMNRNSSKAIWEIVIPERKAR